MSPYTLEILDEFLRRVMTLSPAADAYERQGSSPGTESFDYGFGMRTFSGETIKLRRAEVTLTQGLGSRLQSRDELGVAKSSAPRVQIKIEFFTHLTPISEFKRSLGRTTVLCPTSLDA